MLVILGRRGQIDGIVGLGTYECPLVFCLDIVVHHIRDEAYRSPPTPDAQPDSLPRGEVEIS